MSAPRYTLRVSVKVLGKEPIKGLEVEPSVTVGQVTVTVKQRWPFLILSARDFNSEAEAEAFLQQMKVGLWNIAIEHNIAFKPYFELRSITRPEDPQQAARNLAKSFGQPIKEPIEPVHGLTEEEGCTIFRSDENIRYLAMGEMTAHVSTGWESISRALAEGMDNVPPPADGLDTDLATAVDLYLASFYETTIRARFLTCMTCLEVLAPPTERHAAAVQALSDFSKQVGARLAAATDIEERDALEALLREIDFKKEASIRRRVRHLVLSEAPLAKDARTGLAKKIVAAYDLRGALVHEGAVDAESLHEAHETVLKAVKLLLRARLRLAKQPPDEPMVAT